MNPPATARFDLVVVGATPGGIACAIRAAREGLRVVLTNHNSHIGGMLSNGLGCLDTQYAGKRSPIYSEFCDRLLEHYDGRYGRASEQYRSCFSKNNNRFGTVPAGIEPATSTPVPGAYHGRINFEPHVAERVLSAMVAAETLITLWPNCVPVKVARGERLVEAATFQFSDGQPKRTAEAPLFADCTYEGDLLALAGASYRVGRESRSEFGEQHAGRIFTALHFATREEVGYPRDAVEGRLNLEPYEAISQQIHAGSTGEGDRKVQAYTFRLCLSCDPDNRVMPERPEGYDRSIFLAMKNRWSLGAPLANRKLRWNTSNLPGGSWDYPEASWKEREHILAHHRDHALGFLWFLQHDEGVPEALRKRAAEFGLAKDEFTDNGHVPWEMYVREARRLVGRYIFKEQDATLAPGLERAPIHSDSIAITEWGMDSHSVSMEMTAGSRREGKVLLTELTRPGHVPWRCLLPKELDNLLVPVCLSSTHIGWGTLRLEPTWMHISESAGFAAVLAHAEGTPPAFLDVSRLQRRLVESGVMISFFNDMDMGTPDSWTPTVQFLGTKGFFAGYDARPEAPLDAVTAQLWAGLAGDLLAARGKNSETVRSAEQYPQNPMPLTKPDDFRAVVEASMSERGVTIAPIELAWKEFAPVNDVWTRGLACQVLYRLLVH